MKKKSMITMLVIALMLVLSLTVLSACGKDKDDPPATYSVTVTNGTGGGEYAEGATVKITANAPETGKEFTGWTLDGVTVDDKTKAEITFTMPANAVTATANYGDILYEFALENCTADKESAKFGEEVTFTADEIIGKRFDSWNIKGVDDLTGLDLTKSPLTFTMPANDINVAAVLEDIDYTVTVTDGTADKTTAHYGDSITITANAPETGKEFTSWTLSGVTVDDKTKAEITFTMPANAVTATANYGDILYEFALENCTADKETAKFGEEVTFTADEVIGKRFDSWNIKGVDDLTGLDLTKSPLTITMPANDIVVAAQLEDIEYEVFVPTGSGTADKVKAKYGEIVTVTADETTPVREFASWHIIEGLDATGLDLTKPILQFEMPACKVHLIATYNYIHYKVTVVGGTAQMDADAEPTSEVWATYECPVSISATAPTGQRFVRWTSADGVVFDDARSAETTFTMPAKAVTVTAEFEYINYTVTVVGGTANKTTAHYGDRISITAEIPTGMSFTGWTLEGVTAETGGLSINFTMPANNVTATAKYVYNNYNVTVNGGTAYTDGEPAGSITAEYGDYINIVAEVPTGKRFVKWTSDSADVVFDSETSATTTFEMPAKNVTVTAEFEYIDYTVKVNGGTANKTTARYGDSITITANAPATGMKFTSWTLNGVTVEDNTIAELTFTMPAGNVTATANYESIDYTVTVTGGMAKVNGGVASASVKAHYGDSITITAAAPETGKRFTSWTLDGVRVYDKTKAEITFTMPANAVTATANYDFEDYKIKVTGGTAQVNDGGLSPTLVAYYGDTVKIKAFTPEKGKRFTGWTITGVDTSELVLTNKELTFTMPAGNVTATAVFEDIDYEVKVNCDTIETKTAHYGEEVTITAKNIEGKIFVCWAFTNLDTGGLDLTKSTLTFTMPANNVTAKAIYEELITLTFEGTTAQSEELRYKDNDSKSFRLPLGEGQDYCTYTIVLSNSAFTFKVYGSDGEVIPYDNGDGTMCIDINRVDNYTIRVVNTGSAANCTLTVTQI